MPFEHIIDHGDSLVVVRGSGEGSVEETADSARRLFEDHSICRDYTFMFIVDDIALHPTPDQMWIIVSFLGMMLSRFSGRMAIVTSQVGRVTTANLIAYEADKEGGRIRIFASESEAQEWLLQNAPENSQSKEALLIGKEG
jgi:hypothetical protein